MVDMNYIWLCCLSAELTEVLLVDLTGVVDIWLWCFLVDIPEVLLAELVGVALPLPLWCTNPSSLDFWLGFFYNLYITNILVIFFIRGRGEKFLVTILCIAITPVVIYVPSFRGCYRSSLSGPWLHGGLKNSMLTASLSASQYFNIIVQGVSVYVAWFFPLGHHPRICAWRVRTLH